MNYEQAKKSVGILVVAREDFWGAYLGILLRPWENKHATAERYHWKGEVKIIRCIENPSQLTIDGKNKCSRIAYNPGVINDFNICDIEVA